MFAHVLSDVVTMPGRTSGPLARSADSPSGTIPVYAATRAGRKPIRGDTRR